MSEPDADWYRTDWHRLHRQRDALLYLNARIRYWWPELAPMIDRAHHEALQDNPAPYRGTVPTLGALEGDRRFGPLDPEPSSHRERFDVV